MTEPTVNDDIAWLLNIQPRLIAMNERYKGMVPDNPQPWEPIQMAHIYSGQAIRGCERTASWLRKAVQEVMGGE